MSHSVTSANGSVDEKQMEQWKNNNQYSSRPASFFFALVVVWGGCLSQVGRLLTSSPLEEGRLFEAGANLRLGA